MGYYKWLDKIDIFIDSIQYGRIEMIFMIFIAVIILFLVTKPKE